jgi:hypothetical protein
MTSKNFLDEAAEFAQRELERVGGDPTKLETPLQTVVVIYYVQALIDNGGFQYLFENDLPFSPPYQLLIDAYRRIGAVDAAACIEKAVRLFPFPEPHLRQMERDSFMGSLHETHEFFELGNKVCGDTTVWAALEDYARNNTGSFRIM